MKKLFALALLVILLVSLVACASTEVVEEKTEPQVVAAPAPAEPVEEEPVVEEKVEEPVLLDLDTLAEDFIIPGYLYQLNASKDQMYLIQGLKLTGNRSGTIEGVNGREPSSDNIRFIFELDEWIELTLDCVIDRGITAYVVPHSDDLELYDRTFFENLEDYVTSVNLEKPEEGSSWGEINIYSEYEEGFYDLVFEHNEVPIAMVVIRLYPDEQLGIRSEQELEQIMEELISSSIQK